MKYKETAVFAPSPTKTLQCSATDGGAQPAGIKSSTVSCLVPFNREETKMWLRLGHLLCVLLFVCTATNSVLPVVSVFHYFLFVESCLCFINRYIDRHAFFKFLW